MPSNSETAGLLQGVAAEAGAAKKPMEDASAYFVAPAAKSLGGHIVVAAIADGMGGPEGGAEASSIAVNTVRHFMEQNPSSNPKVTLQRAIEAAHYAVQGAQSASPDRAGMKTTLTLALIADDRLYVGSVGDSRVYLLREGEIQRLTSDRTWVQSALDKHGNLPPPEPIAPTAKHYLGEPGAVKPVLRPVEFLWPGDALLLCTDGLSDFVPDNEIRELMVARTPQETTAGLVRQAMLRGSEDNVTAMAVRMPGGQSRASAPARRRSRLSLSTAAKVLIAGNLLLLCLIEFFVARNTGLLSLISPPTPTVQVAKPVFVMPPTPTPGLAESDALLGLTSTPTAAASSTLTPLSPAAAPTLTLAPTFTPQPVPNAWNVPPPPHLLSPSDGFLFGGLDANVILAWDSVGQLPEDVFYVAVIRKFVDGTLVGESRNWTKATRIKLDPSFYTSNNSRGPRALADLQDANHRTGIPLQQASIVQFEWYVELDRLTQIKPDGSLEGVPITVQSEVLTFRWGPVAPAPAPAPSRVYGNQTLNTDPFFQEQRQRQAASDVALFPISAGMAGFSVLLGALGSWPGFVAKRLRRRTAKSREGNNGRPPQSAEFK